MDIDGQQREREHGQGWSFGIFLGLDCAGLVGHRWQWEQRLETYGPVEHQRGVGGYFTSLHTRQLPD